MRYTVNKISEQSGLSRQTIREYADAGILSCTVDEKNNYRYFDADAVNRMNAVRRLSLMGFSREEVCELVGAMPVAGFEEAVGRRLLAVREEARRYGEIAELLTELREGSALVRSLGPEDMVLRDVGPLYCLDYRRNEELLLDGKEGARLLNAWMEQAMYTKNYSPCPHILEERQMEEHIIGLVVEASYAGHFPLEAPVFRRERAQCACFSFEHDDEMHPKPRSAAFYREKMAAAGLKPAGEAFIIGYLPLGENGKKKFITLLHIPVERV
ncbi:MAG: MerR family transcriptional regulator [Clostridia bacterium]|nr:MerR family transcriptional regulator [Clostridia bacterium]